METLKKINFSHLKFISSIYCTIGSISPSDETIFLKFESSINLKAQYVFVSKMSEFMNVLIFCDHRDSFSVELDYLRKRFADDCGSTKIIALCDYFSDHPISKYELLTDIFITFMDLISVHNIIVFFVSECASESYKCPPNKPPELDSL